MVHYVCWYWTLLFPFKSVCIWWYTNNHDCLHWELSLVMFRCQDVAIPPREDAAGDTVFRTNPSALQMFAFTRECMGRPPEFQIDRIGEQDGGTWHVTKSVGARNTSSHNIVARLTKHGKFVPIGTRTNDNNLRLWLVVAKNVHKRHILIQSRACYKRKTQKTTEFYCAHNKQSLTHNRKNLDATRLQKLTDEMVIATTMCSDLTITREYRQPCIWTSRTAVPPAAGSHYNWQTTCNTTVAMHHYGMGKTCCVLYTQ
jgi:hypothetical protein